MICIKSYSELIKIKNYRDRLDYLMLLDNNALSPRHMSQSFYKTNMWLTTRDIIIKRDLGFDLGIMGVYILDKVLIHHINPIDEYDILNLTPKLLDPENLITTSLKTHNIIHYGQKKEEPWVERRPGDTILW